MNVKWIGETVLVVASVIATFVFWLTISSAIGSIYKGEYPWYMPFLTLFIALLIVAILSWKALRLEQTLETSIGILNSLAKFWAVITLILIITYVLFPTILDVAGITDGRTCPPDPCPPSPPGYLTCLMVSMCVPLDDMIRRIIVHFSILSFSQAIQMILATKIGKRILK